MSSLDLTRDWLKSVLRPYPSRDVVSDEVLGVLRKTSSLAVKTDAFTFDSGATALLVLLHGTIPITYRGAGYHIPINIWLPHEYPRIPPMVFVVPTRDMGVRKGREVEPGGRVRDEVLAQLWSQPPRNLDRVVAFLQEIFSVQPPVYAKPPEQVATPSRSTSLSAPSGPSQSIPPVQPPQPLPAGPPGPAMPARPIPNGESLPQYRAAPTPPPPVSSGQLPGHTSRQSSLSHPAQIPPAPPQSPPVPLRPGQTPPVPARVYRAQTASPLASPVRSSGVAPWHAGYQPPQHAQPPPVPQHPYPHLPQHQPPHPSPGQVYPAYPPSQSPPPVQWQQSQPLPLQQPPHAIPPQQQPQPPPQSASHSLNPPQRAPDLLSSPDTSIAPLPDTDAPPPIPPSKPPPPSLLHLHAILLPHLGSSLPPLMHSLQSTKSHLLERREDLASGEPAVRDEMARLDAVKKVCDAVGSRLDEVVRKGSERVAELEGRGDVGVDEVVCSISIVHNQLIDLVAEDNAISDTIYHVTRALDAERIDLDRYLKAVRSLAREQYMKRALIERILQGMGQSAWSVS